MYTAVRAQNYAALPDHLRRVPPRKRDYVHARAMMLAAKWGPVAMLVNPYGFEQALKADLGITGTIVGAILSMFGPQILAALVAWLVPVLIKWLQDEFTKPKAAGDESVEAMLHRFAVEANAPAQKFSARSTFLALLALTTCALLTGCIQTVDQSKPLPPAPSGQSLEQLNYQAEAAMPSANAQVYESLAARVDSGEFTTASVLKTAVAAECKAVRDKIYAAGDDAFNAATQPGGKFDHKSAASALRALAKGARRAVK